MIQKNVHRAILVNIIPKEANKEEEMKNFGELTRLVETYGGVVIVKILQKRSRPSAKTFLGSGKVEEVKEIAKKLNTDLIIVNDFLKANQSNNLRTIFGCEVWDRFELILKIFEKHAYSEEAKLQIEIASLKYEFPKLFGKGIMLSQQAGHIGVRAGAGEKLLEIKRRHLKRKIDRLEKKLKNIKKIQDGQRYRRKRHGFKMVAMVGYTNSGKSTLLKALTHKQNVRIKDELFSTLDTKIGEIHLKNSHQRVLLADTIGFIQNLPPLLFSSFLATLEEARQADLILHIIDIPDPKIGEKIKVVENILEQLEYENKRKIYVFNKIDLLKDKYRLKEMKSTYKKFTPVFISALKKENLEELKTKIKTLLQQHLSVPLAETSPHSNKSLPTAHPSSLLPPMQSEELK